MKDLIGIKRRQLEYYRSNGFWDSVKKSAGMHGYFGFWKTLHFLWIKTLDSLYNRISYFSPYNGLRLYCQRKRGVKVGKEVLIGMHCVLDEVFPDFITIEDGACLAGRVYVLTHSNAPVFFRNRLPSYVAPVIIKTNVKTGASFRGDYVGCAITDINGGDLQIGWQEIGVAFIKCMSGQPIQ